MSEVCYVFSGERGWWGKNGQWTSQVREAAPFQRDHAITFCKNHRSQWDAPLGVVPVREEDVTELLVTR